MAAPWTFRRARSRPAAPPALRQRAARSLDRLAAWCRERDYRGADPYDGLASPIARAFDRLPYCRILRLAWTQGFKHLPIDLRKLAGIPPLENAKALALFIEG
ncbi:MAG: hypothetical protein HY720_12860, partial [Planctomycetes bacterium]|nr:hypothetical protein [Planctomycetota bacterium]